MALTMVTATVPNEPGQLAAITQALADAGLNVLGFSCDVDHVHVLTDDGDAAAETMRRLSPEVKQGPVIDVRIDNRRGRLAELCQRLADAGINIQVGYGAGFSGEGRVFLRVSDEKRAAAIIKAMFPHQPVVAHGLKRI